MASQRPGVRGPGAAHAERRRRILDAVFAIVDAEGTDQISIRHVANRAGVSVGRVQHYFPSKDALLAEAFAAINARGSERVRARLTAGDGLGDPEAVLAEVLDGLLPRTEEDRRLFRVAQAFETFALPRPALKEQVARGYDDLASLVALLLSKIAAPGPSGDLASLRPRAYRIVALAIGLAGLVMTENLTPEQAREIVSAHVQDSLRE
ncbi:MULTISPECIES: TetR/AcrR family transcriptional regulator [Actinomadura]|uniref:TetR/AcrR family transcriptional regulator n=1 Tax=Actinomadura TaxID=1988 RepID=UPI000555D0FD|nr:MULTISPECIES: TetR/AcrR family transcriptional regulator [Actinomadura]RSN56761.1 TetR/AcrR family transcriptional regulator [Actinomadura sp. WAC 06369]